MSHLEYDEYTGVEAQNDPDFCSEGASLEELKDQFDREQEWLNYVKQVSNIC